MLVTRNNILYDKHVSIGDEQRLEVSVCVCERESVSSMRHSHNLWQSL